MYTQEITSDRLDFFLVTDWDETRAKKKTWSENKIVAFDCVFNDIKFRCNTVLIQLKVKINIYGYTNPIYYFNNYYSI